MISDSAIMSTGPPNFANKPQFPAGHVNHLTEGQFGQLVKFKELCLSKGYWTPEAAGKPASHDDETLLRYLRARKFVPSEAFAQFKDTEDWRKENEIDKLYETIDVQEYERERRLYPQWLGRRDKRGIPLYLFEVANLDSKAMTGPDKSSSKKTAPVNSKVSPKMLRLFALYENLCTFVLPLCSDIPNRPNEETPISQSNNIVDISGVGIRQFWNLKQHMQDASLLATAHYPETLDRIFIIGAPSFFPTVWGWIKRWFDPVTVVCTSRVASTTGILISRSPKSSSCQAQTSHQHSCSTSTRTTSRRNMAAPSSSSMETFLNSTQQLQTSSNGRILQTKAFPLDRFTGIRMRRAI